MRLLSEAEGDDVRGLEHVVGGHAGTTGVALRFVRFRDQLPDGCPPKDATVIGQPVGVYRLVQGFPPKDLDFLSSYQEHPEKRDDKRSRGQECEFHGLSVFAGLADVENAQRLPTQQGKLICVVHLEDGAGAIKQTGSTKSHRTWWPSEDFDIISHCERMAR